MLACYVNKVFNGGLSDLNRRARELLEPNSSAAVLDLGTGDAETFLWWAEHIQSRDLHALDAVPNDHSDRIKTIITSLEQKFPFDDNSFDCVTSSQNIEHIVDTPLYLAEIQRILKPGGYAVILTENLASWANIAALVCGWLPFSSTLMFGYSFGNRLIWHDSLPKTDMSRFYKEKIWGCLGHQRLFTPFALKQISERHGFRCEAVFGAGYAPLFGVLSRWLSRLNPAHCHFIGVKLRKPIG